MGLRERLFGQKAAPTGSTAVSDTRGGWLNIIREGFAGAFQNDVEWTNDTVLAHHAVFACVTLISQDVGKLRAKLVQQGDNGIWQETTSAAFSPILSRPNRYQNHIQFKEWWITSKLLRGNTYALKERDNRGVVRALYLLDPSRVTVLVTPDGSVYYELQSDNLSGLEKGSVTVPASEILHDRMNCLFHPLVGVSPIYASGAAANIGLKIQSNSTNFFAKGSNPSGILTAPEEVTKEAAKELAETWRVMFSGDNAGRVAVLGNNMKFEPMRMSAVESQTIEQLRWSAETVCATFHVPPFKIGIGTMPTYQNGEILNQIYYSDCLQAHIESMELVLDDGLGLSDKKDGKTYGVELDLDALLRMDSATQIRTLAEAVKGGIYSPNEARAKVDQPPVVGGESPMVQQQNFSLAALAKRDAKDDPFASAQPTPVDGPPPTARIDALPTPKDGEPGVVDMDAVGLLVTAATDAARASLEADVVERIADAVAGIPVPEPGAPGKDADMEVLVDLIQSSTLKAVGDAVEKIPAAKDGVGIVNGTINREGELSLSLSNGSIIQVGKVVGKDADPPVVIHGKDGVGFDDLSVEFDGERTIEVVFQKGDEVKRFPVVMPIVIDRGVFKEGTDYEKGDGVTWAGSFWIAQEKTANKPGEGATGWRLAVKKGRDGK